MNKKSSNIIVLDENLDNSSLNINTSGKYELDCLKRDSININIEDNIDVSILEIKRESKGSKAYNYYLNDNSKLIINKFYDLKDVNEEINIYLNGYNSSVICNLSSISTGNHYYKINVYSNNKNTRSYSNIHGFVVDNNSIVIENNGYIPKGNSGAVLNQDNKIITMGDNNSSIKPNLFIDEYDVEAMHGAYIGKFNEDEIFYLKTRGLSEKDSNNLLIQGFLINELDIDEDNEKIIRNIINEYWR